MLRRTCLSLAVLLFLASWSFAEDIVLMNGTVVDGSGKPRVQANVRISGGKVDEIGPFRPRPGENTLDVRGLVIAPGFVDINNHSAGVLAGNPMAASQIAQGITTVAFGLDGEGPIEVEAFMARFDGKPSALNVVTFAGHNTARRQVMGLNANRPANAAEIEKITDLVDRAMREGAFGLSVNLESGPGASSALDELTALGRAVARYAGIVTFRLRSDAAGVVAAVHEVAEIGRIAKVPVHISHLRLRTTAAWGMAAAVLAEVEGARKAGVDITADVSPYDSQESEIGALLPDPSRNDPDSIVKAVEALGGPERIVVTRAAGHPDYGFKTLADIANTDQVSVAAAFAGVLQVRGRVITSSLSMPDVVRLLQSPTVIVASDGGIGDPHPRGAGAFARVVGPLARDEKILTLEEAVRRVSAQPAARLSLRGRSILQKGSVADIVLFDPLKIGDRSTLLQPGALAEGMRYVFIGGVLVLKDGVQTEERPGTALR